VDTQRSPSTWAFSAEWRWLRWPLRDEPSRRSPQCWRRRNPSDLVASLYEITSGTADPSTFSTTLTARVAALPGVRRAEAAIGLNAYRLGSTGSPIVQDATKVTNLGSVSGLHFDVDRPAVLSGRMADPQRPDEVVVSPDAAHALGVQVGGRFPLGLYPNSALASQASVSGAIGVIVGLPLGIALGRSLWRVFAAAIYAVPDPTVPWAELGVVAIVAMAATNLIALKPARRAAGTSVASALRAD